MVVKLGAAWRSGRAGGSIQSPPAITDNPGVQLMLLAREPSSPAVYVEEGPGNPAEAGDSVTRWLDSSGNGNHMDAQGTAPLWNENWSGVPGFGVLTTQSPRWFKHASSSFADFDTTDTFYGYVVLIRRIAGTHFIMDKGFYVTSVNSNGWCFFIDSDSDVNLQVNDNANTDNGRATVSSIVPVDTKMLLSFSYKGSGDPSTFEIRKNGVLQTTSTSGTTVTGSLTNSSNLNLSHRNNGASPAVNDDTLNGIIYEAGLYSPAPTGAFLSTIESNIISAHGI